MAKEYSWPPAIVANLTMYQALVYFGADVGRAPERNSTVDEVRAHFSLDGA